MSTTTSPLTLQSTRALRGGVALPYLGFGTYLIPDAQAAALVLQAIEAGYRHIDTAEFYQNERGVGEGIRQALDRGLITRDELVVTTKLWPGNSAWGQTPKTTATTISSLEESLERLGLEQVDLYLIHATFDPAQRLAQWRGMVELQQQGKARAIGVSNFNINHIEELEAAGLPLPAADQIELHPWSQKPELTRYLEEREIVPIAYSSLVPLSSWRAAPGQGSGKTAAMQQESEREDSPFKAMADAHGVTEAQLLLRWGVQKGYPVLPKSTHLARIRQNADLFSFTLSEEEMALLEAQDRGRGVAWGAGEPLDFA